MQNVIQVHLLAPHTQVSLEGLQKTTELERQSSHQQYYLSYFLCISVAFFGSLMADSDDNELDSAHIWAKCKEEYWTHCMTWLIGWHVCKSHVQ